MLNCPDPASLTSAALPAGRFFDPEKLKRRSSLICAAEPNGMKRWSVFSKEAAMLQLKCLPGETLTGLTKKHSWKVYASASKP